MPTIGNGIITYSEEEVAEYNAAAPELAYYFELIREYAVAQGGAVLTVWESLQGPLFGKNYLMRPDVAAAQLGMPLSQLAGIYADTMTMVRPVWEASPQYAAYAQANPTGN
jgi:hypothetical protein